MSYQLKMVACPWRRNRSHVRDLGGGKPTVWLHDGSPGTNRDDSCREVVGWSSKTTRDTLEERLRWAIGPSNVPASRARLAGVSRVHEDNWNPRQSRLVGTVLLNSATLVVSGLGMFRAIGSEPCVPLAERTLVPVLKVAQPQEVIYRVQSRTMESGAQRRRVAKRVNQIHAQGLWGHDGLGLGRLGQQGRQPRVVGNRTLGGFLLGNGQGEWHAANAGLSDTFDHLADHGGALECVWAQCAGGGSHGASVA